MQIVRYLTLMRKPRAFLRLALGKLLRRHNWQGIELSGRDFPDRPADGFNSDQWLEPLRLSSLETLRFYEKHSAYGPETNPHGLLSALAATTVRPKVPVTIVDIGGGLGTSFIGTRANGPFHSGLNFHVVEIPRLAQIGDELFKGHRGIQFHSQPPELEHVDICYISTALQYFKDFEGIVKRLKAYNPKFLIFAKLSAGDIPTFWTWQLNVEGHKIPYWFINIGELKALVGDAYEMIYDEKIPNAYNMSNFPTTHRLTSFRNIVFVRKTATAASP